MGGTKKVLIGAALGAGAALVDALRIEPYNLNACTYKLNGCIPQTLPGIIMAYVALLLPWVLVAVALIGFLVSLIDIVAA
jgi:hypothetical protein